MAFLKTNVDKSAVKETTGGGNYISKSGIYEVMIERASVSKTKNGATSVDFTLVNEAGNESTFYNNIVLTTDGNDTDKNGRQLSGGALLNKIAIIHGLESIDDPVETEVVVGKDKKKLTLDLLEDLADLPLTVQVQEEYSKYNDEIRKKLVIKSVFRQSDHATAEEIVADAEGDDVEIGSQFKTISEKYADKVTYQDGLTEDEVEEWKKAQQESRESGSSAKTTAKPTTSKKGALFKK